VDKDKIEYWANQIRLQKESGISQQKWCEQNGIKYHTMKSWGTKIKKADEKPETQFIELKPAELAIQAENIEITIGKISLKVTHQNFSFVIKELVKLC